MITPVLSVETSHCGVSQAVTTGLGIREYYNQFNTAGHRIVYGGSLDRRPDAFSLSHQVSTSIGPDQLGDGASAPDERVWYARNQDNGDGTFSVFVARSTSGNVAWDTEQFLFSYNAPGATEIDLSFEQAARAVVVAERPTGAGGASEVWIYWYDPALLPTPGFTFVNKGPGRTPKVVLDDIKDTTNADVQIIYLKPGVGMVRLEQRSRYETEYPTVLPYSDNYYLEEFSVSRGWRLIVEYTERNTVTGRYELFRVESHPYPIYLDPEAVTNSIEYLSSVLFNTLISLDLYNKDSVALSLDVVSAALMETVITHILYDIEEVTLDLAVTSAALILLVLVVTLYDKDEVTGSVEYLSGELIRLVIEHILFDKDSATLSLEYLSATLEEV